MPAILSEDVQDFARKAEQANRLTDYIQVDFMDGRLVPSRSIDVSQLKQVPIDFDIEAHLMVEAPTTYLADFDGYQALKKVVFHLECSERPSDVIAAARGLGIRVGVALNPATPTERAMKELDGAESVLFLAVEPGYYGRSFMPEVLEKVRAFKARHPRVEAGVDGGVKLENIKLVWEAGADAAYVGSGIFSRDDPQLAYHELLEATGNP